MRCAAARKKISEYADGRLGGKISARLETHLETCSACREILKDFLVIAAEARRLETPDPPERVWTQIRSRLEAASTAAPAPVPVQTETARRSLWTLGPAWRFAAAAGLLLAVLAGGLFWGVRLGKQGVPVISENGENYVLAKLDEAERYYILAIRSLTAAFSDQRGQLPPEIAEIFERNFEVFDATIQACREAVLIAPDDIQARTFLLSAYREKVIFLDNALSFRETSWEVTPGTTL